ncbi:MAG: hypothetical protein U9N40_09520 [Euryarchaeota archaeon]|nr:hypothetical protein [Euryarchaeota archaeon]
MEAAERLFAGEILHSQYCTNRKMQSPSGAGYSRLFIVGTLTEVTGSPETGVRARVSDPTGTILLFAGRDNQRLAGTFCEINPPQFVAVTGYVNSGRRSNSGEILIIPEAVSVVNREIRDIWILRTAEITIQRLEEIPASAGGDNNVVHTVVPIIRKALSVVNVQPVSVPDVCLDKQEILIDLISKHSGPRGITVEMLMKSGKKAGLSDEYIKKGIDDLLSSGECYMPSNELIKLL